MRQNPRAAARPGGLVASTPQAIADAAVRLYQDKNLWLAMQQNGCKILDLVFNKSAHGAALVERLERRHENLAQHRLHNFDGAMLRHHQHRSTQYMARRIEVKNKLASGSK